MSNPFQFVMTTQRPGVVGVIQQDGQVLLVDMQQLVPPIAPLPPLQPQPPGLQGGLIVDPQNATGVATATGASTATVAGVTGRVFDTYANLAKAWGTLAPVFNTTTQIVWASSQTTNSDPVLFYPIMLGAHAIAIKGAGLQQVATATLTLVTAKNRSVGANSLLIVSYSSGAAATGQIVANTTKSSLAWIYSPSGEGNFAMSQPLGLQSPGGTTTPVENNIWATSDNMTLNTLISIDLVDVRPRFCDYAGNPGQQGMSIYQCNWLSPASNEFATVGPYVAVRECSINRIVNTVAGTNDAANQTWFSNCIFTNGGGLVCLGGSPTIIGGFVDDTAALFAPYGSPNPAIIDADFIAGSWTDPGQGTTTGPAYCGVYFGAVYLDAPIVLQGPSKVAAAFYGQGILYGSGGETVNLIGSMHLAQLQDTFVSTFTAPGLVTGILINSANTASSHTNANNPDVIHSNITTTPAHLDAATGVAGFGGNAFNLGGASVGAFA